MLGPPDLYDDGGRPAARGYGVANALVTTDPVRGTLDASGSADVTLVATEDCRRGPQGEVALYRFATDAAPGAYARFAMPPDDTNLATAVVTATVALLERLEAPGHQVDRLRTQAT